MVTALRAIKAINPLISIDIERDNNLQFQETRYLNLSKLTIKI